MPARVSSCILLLTLFMFLLALPPVADLEGISAQSATVVSEPEKRGMLFAGTPHGPIGIDGDVNFSATALLEGWSGDGSLESPYIIDGLEIDLGGEIGHCINISNTRVSFTISNCYLTRANVTYPGGMYNFHEGAGIYLQNVSNGELINNTCYSNIDRGIYLERSSYNRLVNNTCNNNTHGILIYDSYLNTLVNNICNDNYAGISLEISHSNTVENNTCTANENGIFLSESDSNAVVNNTCISNGGGIYLISSDSNTLTDNTCISNTGYGIWLYRSDSNSVSYNICNNNRIGIYLYFSDNNTVTHNTCLSNTEHDIFLSESDSNTVENNITTEFHSRLLLLGGVLLLIPLGIVVLGSRRRMVSTKGYKDDIIVPTRYRLASRVRKRRALKHVDVDEPLEPDSSDQ